MRRSRAPRDFARIARAAALIALGACSGFPGCTGSLFQSKAAPPAVYMLSANLGTAAGAPAVPADLAVLRPRIRPGLETDRVAVLYPDRHLDYLADVRWSGPLDQVVQDLAVRAFATGARLRTVGTDSSAFTSSYWLEIEVTDFQAEYPAAGSAPTIHVHLLARVGGAGDRRIVGSFDASARETASGNRVSAIVDAYERAADAALAQIVASTSRALTGNLEQR
jgi:cholesterol transport system auxiliary component